MINKIYSMILSASNGYVNVADPQSRQNYPSISDKMSELTSQENLLFQPYSAFLINLSLRAQTDPL